nr:MAG TPA: peptidase [Microviridae sp.]
MNSALMCFLEHLLCFNFHFTVTSAKRSIADNKAVGGVPDSQHLFGEAIDIKPYGSTTYNRLLDHIHSYSDNVHVFDQLILYPNFIHISFGDRNRRQVIDKRK